MKTQSGLWLSSLLLLTSSCAGDDVGGFTLSASQIIAGNKAHEPSTAQHASVSNSATHQAVPPAHADAEQEAQYDTDAVVEAGEATTEGDAATQAVAQDGVIAPLLDPDAGPTPVDADAGTDAATAAPSDVADEAETDSGLRLIDGQIAAVLSAANRAVIAQAGAVLAGNDTDGDAIATLAAELSAQHATAQARQQQIVAQKRMTPKETPLSNQLNQDANARLQALSAADACEREHAFLNQLVEGHSQLIALFETVLMPSVCDGELKSELSLAYEALEGELARAKLLLAAEAE